MSISACAARARRNIREATLISGRATTLTSWKEIDQVYAVPPSTVDSSVSSSVRPSSFGGALRLQRPLLLRCRHHAGLAQACQIVDDAPLVCDLARVVEREHEHLLEFKALARGR